MSDVTDLIHRFFGPFTLTQGYGVANAGTPEHERHTGIDIGEPTGTAVRATERGKVKKIYSDRIGGLQEDVQVSNGYDEIFAHLSDVTAHVGQDVGPNDVIAHSGQSGGATGPHLHFEVRDSGGRDIDPIPFLHDEAAKPPSADPTLPGDKTCAAGFHLETITIGPLRYNKCTPDTSLPDAAKSAVTGGIDSVKSGVVKFTVAAAIIGAIAYVGVRGAKQTLE